MFSCTSSAHAAIAHTRRHRQLPPEIWQKIFGQACVDGGPTGRSLALTSRRFRKLSASIRLQSVSVVGLRELVSFLDFLKRLEEPDRRVRSLFFGYKPDDVLERLWARPLRHVLAVLAPHLQTLAMHVSSSAKAKLFSVPFPALRDLTCGLMWLTLPPTTMPGLRRLHIVGPLAPRQLLTDLAPMRGLECLRLSGENVDEGRYLYADALADVFGPAGSNKRPAGVFDDLRTLTIELEEPNPDWGDEGPPICGNWMDGWVEDFESLETFVNDRRGHGDRLPDIHMVPSRIEGYSLDVCAHDWRDMVEMSGDGPWAISREEALS
jgi:hypothetical protein